MPDDPVPDDDPELVAILGANLLPRFNPEARATLKWEATKHPAGVARIARAVLDDPSIRNPCGVILHRLEQREHLDATPTPTPRTWPAATPPRGPQPCPTCGNPPYGYRPVIDGCRTCGRPHTTRPKQERTP